jgi:hypothetical protein
MALFLQAGNSTISSWQTFEKLINNNLCSLFDLFLKKNSFAFIEGSFREDCYFRIKNKDLDLN